MSKVIDKLRALQNSKKDYSAKVKKIRDSELYSEVGKQEKIQKLKSEHSLFLDNTLTEVSALIDEKSASLKSVNTKVNDPAYQQLISNALTKLNMLGDAITPEVLKSILAPIVEAEDTETLSVVRAFVRARKVDDFTKAGLMNELPVVEDNTQLLANWKKSINENFQGLEYTGELGIEEMILAQLEHTIIGTI